MSGFSLFLGPFISSCWQLQWVKGVEGEFFRGSGQLCGQQGWGSGARSTGRAGRGKGLQVGSVEHRQGLGRHETVARK